MTVNWKALAPHRPVQPGDSRYVDRPETGATRIVDMVRSGQSTILVAGPLGIGKSTELAQAAEVLESDRVSCLVQLGVTRSENMRQITSDQALLRIAGNLASLAIGRLNLELSTELRHTLVHFGVLDRELLEGVTPGWTEGSARSIAHATIREVSRLSPHERVTLLIDGLEKTPEGPARIVFDALAELAEVVELVVVVPWHAAYGPNMLDVVRTGEKLMVLRPVEVETDSAMTGRSFLSTVLAKRLGLHVGVLDEGASHLRSSLRALGREVPPEAMPSVVSEAARWSGGIPRAFLQLMADAASYAYLDRGAQWPDPSDMAAAVHDQIESTRRLLLPGDERALRWVDGSDGRELALYRKLRLLQNGLLIECTIGGSTALRVHPFVRPLIPGLSVD